MKETTTAANIRQKQSRDDTRTTPSPSLTMAELTQPHPPAADDIISSPPSPNPRKRPAQDQHSPSKKPLNLRGDQFIMPTPPDTDNSSPANNNDRQGSPESSVLSSVGDSPEATAPTSTTKHSASDSISTAFAQPPAKRRKITLAEKAEKERLKAVNDRAKAEAKAKKDEEKRAKDEEKRKKAEEREAKKREKELDKERAKQAQLKKQQSQMRLGAFFQKPATPVKQDESGAAVEGTAGSARRKSLSLEPFDAVAEQIRKDQGTGKGTPKIAEKQARSDYHKFFLPFELPSHCTLAPTLHSNTSQRDADVAQAAFDSELVDPSLQEKYDLGLVSSYASLEAQFANERVERGLSVPSVVELIKSVNGSSSQQPIDLTREKAAEHCIDVLRSLPMRHLHFAEDVRPAYYGSYTKLRSPRAARKLRRNPFARERKDTDYDYDSEAEWEEGEEGGEDIFSDGEDDAESQGDAEDAEFLDDEEDVLKNKRKTIVTDLIPVSTGLCWQNSNGKLEPSTENANPAKDLTGMSMGFLLPGSTATSIDPFSTVYWQPTQTPALSTNQPSTTNNPTTHPLMIGTMPPPRQPLQSRTPNNIQPSLPLIGAAEGMKGPIDSLPTSSTQTQQNRGRKPAPKTLSEDELAAFRDAVVGSGLNKADLSKGLKTRFPKFTNEVIRETLGSCFAQVGPSRAEKKWVFVGGS